MKNFINVRIKTYNASKEKNDIKHNLRKVKNRSQIIDPKYQNTYRYFGDYNSQNILKKYDELREEHNTKYKKRRKENITNSNATLINSVITFSEKINKDLDEKYTREEFENVCENAIKDISNFLETDLLYISFHYDEKTPHVHFHMRNFDEQGRSIFYKNRTKDKLSKLQDIAYNRLKKLGMNRGEKKEVTNKTHQTTKQYYSKLYQELNKKMKEMRKDIQNLKNIENDEKKKIYQEISSIQKKLRTLKAERDEYSEELKVFEKIANKEKLNEDDKKILKVLAPVLFDILPNPNSKNKKELNNIISNAFKM